MTRRFIFAAGLALTLAILLAPPRAAARADLPPRLSDREFWRLSTDSSEADGYFRSDNLTSNELLFQRVIPDLVARSKAGGVYLGVGPEQNFTYMAALRPAMAIIFDIRRGNMLVQLMYKAIFELTKDRADFVSMLFSRRRPAGLGADSTVAALFSAFAAVQGDSAMYARNLEAIEARLTKTHGLALSSKDLEGLEYAYHAFFSRGYSVRYSPTYAELMAATDRDGVQRGYLATEASFAFLKDLESRNFVVPVIGDFGGPKAIRAVATYLKAHEATVTAFYLSNVEQYLYQDGKWNTFCRNFATLPLDPSSTFIRSMTGRGVGFGVGFVSSLGSMVSEARECE
jgi:hypothetical protein